jgi:hypothetical protein
MQEVMLVERELAIWVWSLEHGVVAEEQTKMMIMYTMDLYPLG